MAEPAREPFYTFGVEIFAQKACAMKQSSWQCVVIPVSKRAAWHCVVMMASKRPAWHCVVMSVSKQPAWHCVVMPVWFGTLVLLVVMPALLLDVSEKAPFSRRGELAKRPWNYVRTLLAVAPAAAGPWNVGCPRHLLWCCSPR